MESQTRQPHELQQSGQPFEKPERYRRLIEAVTDYLFTVNVSDGRPVQTLHGPGCEAVTGYTADELNTNPELWIAMVPEEDREAVHRQVERVLSGQTAFAEHRLRRKDGEIRWVVSTVVPQHDEQGRLNCYDGLIRDITERKQAEAALQQFNKELEQRVAEGTQEIRLLAEAVSHLGEGVVITDDDLDWPGPQIRFVNEAMCHITGYASDELIGQSPRILQGEGTNREVLKRMKADLSVRRSCLVELVNYRKDGTPYDAELFITPLYDAEGRRTNFVSIHRDISDRKRAERELQDREARLLAIWNTAADAMITIDRAGIIDGLNPAAEQLFGYSYQELIGRNVKILMPSPYRDEHDGYIARYLQTGEARIIGIGREVVAQHKQGHLFPIDLALSEIDHQQRFTGIIRDISERKALQGHLLTIAAEEQRRIGQDLHDGLGQELLALGMTAGTLVESLKRLSPTAEVAGVLALGRKLDDGLRECLRQVRALSRGLVPVDVDAGGLASALSDLARQISQLHGVNCKFVSSHGVAIDDSSIATHLYRIAQEAVTNALKHGKGRNIEISLEEREHLLALQVEDDGTGIPQPMPLHGGMGLRTMNYRAGLIGARLSIETGKNGGTIVSCLLNKKLLEGKVSSQESDDEGHSD